MVKIVRTPDIAREYFTANQLSGFPNGIQYSPRELKLRRKYAAQNNLQIPTNDQPIPSVNIGRKLGKEQ